MLNQENQLYLKRVAVVEHGGHARYSRSIEKRHRLQRVAVVEHVGHARDCMTHDLHALYIVNSDIPAPSTIRCPYP